MATEKPPIEMFDPNTDADGKISKVMLPSQPAAFDADHYMTMLNQNTVTKAVTTIDLGIEEIIKAGLLTAPPNAYSFSNIQLMPDENNSGIIPWPGISPETLSKIVAENVAPQLIIGMRVGDVLRYSQYSTHPWRPGWRLELVAGDQSPTEQDRKDILAGRQYLENSNTETSSVLERDSSHLDGFQHFLAAMVRDSFTFDGIAIWRKMSKGNQVLEYKLQPAGNIRLVNQTIGFLGDKNVFAVLLDQGGNIAKKPGTNDPITFSREELVWYVRNPRTDARICGYGLPEVETGIRLIGGYQNVLDLNCDTFTKNTVPNGLLLLKGNSWTQKQIDVLGKAWGNLMRGITKRWSLPVLGAPQGSEIEIVDLKDLTGTDVRYQDFLNMVMGGLATIFLFPVARLGYRISGHGTDTVPVASGSTVLVGDDDPGLKPLLIHIENIINQYLLQPNFPTLKFVFCGKSPVEDAREYQSRVDAMTWEESRAEADLPSVSVLLDRAISKFKLEKDEEADKQKRELFALLSLMPLNPNMSGTYQSIVAAYVKSKQDADLMDQQMESTPGNQIAGVKDPATRASHGHMAGVRRDSKAEKQSAGTKK